MSVTPRWAGNILVASLGLKPGERLLVLCDPSLEDAGAILVAAARVLEAGEGQMLLLPDRGRGLTALPTAFLQTAAEADVVLAMRSELELEREDPFLRSAMAAFRQAGRGRWASLAQIDQSVLEQELSGDFGAIAAEAERLASDLRAGVTARIRTAAGTDLRLSYEGRPLHLETGVIRGAGAVGNLPAGEVFVAPLEESAAGQLVVDRCLGDISLDRPVTLTFARGRVVRVEGGQAAAELQARLGDDPWGWTIGEFGLGANPHVSRRGRVAIDEKALGTAHIALGGNRSFGGQNPAGTHYDCVIDGPQIEIS